MGPVGDVGAGCCLGMGIRYERAAEVDGGYRVAGREGHHGVWKGGLWRRRGGGFL